MEQLTLLATINTKLQKLVQAHVQLKKEHAKLKNTLTIAEQKEQAWVQKEEELTNQLALLQAAKKGDGATANPELENKINDYIRNIDKAIALLNE
jgi:hypothetical protein